MIKFPKKWGHEELLGKKPGSYMFKRLLLKQGKRTSLHFHKEKQETLLVISGALKVLIDGRTTVLGEGDYINIAPYSVHRMEAETDCLYVEGSTDHPEDVVRLEDDYGRVEGFDNVGWTGNATWVAVQ